LKRRSCSAGDSPLGSPPIGGAIFIIISALKAIADKFGVCWRTSTTIPASASGREVGKRSRPQGEGDAPFPNAGGMDLTLAREFRSRVRTSSRRLVVVKGYQHFAGRALTALEALERCADALRSFEVVLFSVSREVADRARDLRRRGTLNIWISEYLPHEQMLKLHSRARVYLAVSISDAISTSMLEAIAMGAFPIQTNTSCSDEWIEDGESGFIVDPKDIEGIADSVRMAVTDDELVDHAAELNWATVQKRLDQNHVAQQVHDLYESIFEDISKRM